MRKIGSLPTAEQAQRFRRYLAAQGIDSRVDPSEATWLVWIVEEDNVERGRSELAAFASDPADHRFDAPEPPPPPPPPRVVRLPRPRLGVPPVTLGLLILSVLVTLATDFGKSESALTHKLWLTNYVRMPGMLLPKEVADGEVWRLYTPIFIHLDGLHLLFNMYALWVLGGSIERVRGSGALLWIVLLVAPFSNMVQFYVTSSLFGGMSGVVYGLFGFIWLRSLLLPNDGLIMPQQVAMLMMIWLVLCLFPGMNMANGVHFGGLVAGSALGAMPRLWRTAWQ